VLLDLKLPKANGLEVLKELKNDPATKPIPVVILAASRKKQGLVSGWQFRSE
jgi:CheY-like chemotaxis protein